MSALTILPFPEKDIAKTRIEEIVKVLMNDGDYTTELLAELVEYWGSLEEHSHASENIFFHLKLAHEWVLFSNDFESIIDKGDA